MFPVATRISGLSPTTVNGPAIVIVAAWITITFEPSSCATFART
jgi:hypothetical protein